MEPQQPGEEEGMATDFTIMLEDRPGTLAELGEATGRAGVDLRGVCGFPCEGRAEIHVVALDADGARRAFQEAALDIRAEREVIVVDCPDRPGGLGEVARRIADAGVNVDLVYLTADGGLVIGADNLDKAQATL
jgi:hypothetical protein